MSESSSKISAIADDKDLYCEGVEGVTIERLARVPSSKNIRLSERFLERPAPQQIDYLHSLASALNQAVDIMQRERNEINEVAIKQERQLFQQHAQHQAMAQQIQLQTEQSNAKAEQRIQEMMELKAEKRKLELEIRELKRG